MADKKTKLQNVIDELNPLLDALYAAGKEDAAKVVTWLVFASFVPGAEVERHLFPKIKEWVFDNIDIQVDEAGNFTIDHAWPDTLG